ncbi:MAG: ATP-binding cassette domain-containing protein [Thermotogaceae bacterium]|nr:ATP-binding cassette domain-containing protein [Thermotogaceae bacterium]
MELKVEKLGKKFQKRWILKDIDFQVSSGEVVLLLGANATGKSTLLKLIATVYKPTSGKIFFNGVDVGKFPKYMRERVSYIPEIPILVNELSLNENLNFFAHLYSFKGDLEKLKREFDLKDGKKPVLKLSKGMKQRLSIATAMMRNPDVVVMDEPASGLDRETIAFILNLIKTLSNQGKIVIVSSHDEEDLAKIATRVFVIGNGKLICDRPMEEVQRNRIAEVSINGETKQVKLHELENMREYKILRVFGIRESIVKGLLQK